MIYNVEQYINDYFINLKSKKLSFSEYIIRKSLLEAVNELKPILHGKVLDLACGVMPYKEYLLNQKITEYIGMDLEPTEYHHHVKPDIIWDGKTISIEDNSVDFVIATEFLEHYFDTASILQEIKRVLKPGGIFFFTVPSIWPLHEAPYDYHRFSPFTLEENFKRTEFSNWQVKPLGGFDYHLAVSLALWYDNNLSINKRKLIKPFLSFVLKKLMKKDIKRDFFKNGQLFSGLYGFVTK
ncbi:class I SAM-dependent methyltransferase [Flavobacterium turcicum]|uniref:Class I SAM-dependent methyltransferase n=1 Tax=Flavobacterium turcicum TaxID=2764718 RepID=A0ABR7JGM7_9FLAO|nr:class I SAM-dependent methyltransferase [Flavobacterium turcicum]MBC5863654.1 class I SAM-dependent methyltransferase [Flavobacterium turcicum]NHL02396.1 class I SAM-dependent methyltransferase [Flavobacterium turcicum]